MLARFHLTGDAKLWWKQWCKDEGVLEGSQSWENVKNAVKGRYLPPAHEAIKMNEFFSLKQASLTLEEYYSKFVTLRRYAPALTSDQQVARFCQGLIEPLNTRLEAMRPCSIQDALIRAKPLAKELTSTFVGEISSQNAQAPQLRRNQTNPQPAPFRPRVYSTNGARPSRGNCFGCGEFGHYQRDCPNLAQTNQAPQAGRGGRGGRNGNGGRGGRNGNGGRGRGRGANAQANAINADEPTLADVV